MTTLTVPQMNVLLVLRGAHAEPRVRDGETEPYGFILRGPRGSRKFIATDDQGKVPLFDVALWIDGLDYSNKRAAERRAAKR